MQLSLKWLEKHLILPSIEWNIILQLEEILNKLGFETKNVRLINPLLLVTIQDVQVIPKMRLKYCKTKIPNELSRFFNYQEDLVVLCGANNPKSGMQTVLVPIKTTLPNGITIEERKIGNYISQGMFAAPEEIGYSKKRFDFYAHLSSNKEEGDQDGILEFYDEKEGLYSMEDVIFDVELPTNRADIMCVRGLAREISYFLGELKPLSVGNTEGVLNLQIVNHTQVPISFMAVDNIVLSPEIIELMNTLGFHGHPLQLLNDFIILDIGCPIHIYDKKYIGNTITIGSAPANQQITTVNNQIYETQGWELLIYNQEDLLAIAGVFGVRGFDQETKNVVIECGLFDHVRSNNTASAKLYNLGVDKALNTLSYVASLVQGLKSNIIYSGLCIPNSRTILLSLWRFYEITNLSYSLNQIQHILEKMHFKCKICNEQSDITGEFGLQITVPSWRSDITNDSDIIEEILRFNGYGTYETNQYHLVEIVPAQTIEKSIVDKLVSEGYGEHINIPFVGQEQSIKILNSIQSDKPYLRNTLLFGLLDNMETEIGSGAWGGKYFEFGKIYNREGEQERLGILLWGQKNRTLLQKKQRYNIYDFKYELFTLDNYCDLNFHEEKQDFYGYEKILVNDSGYMVRGVHKGQSFYYYETTPKIKINAPQPKPTYKYIDITVQGDSWEKIAHILPWKYNLFDIYENKYSFTLFIPREEIDRDNNLLEKLKEKLNNIV